MQPTDDDISYAENILFGETGIFDEERKDFIKEFNTCDLQAVPGSGKTTALLAKFLILERYLPEKNGRGILVLSHTNAAIDEIKSKIGRHCPKLFSAPNFVGTIQSFVDHFLAIPYYTQKLGRRPIRIDDELYYEKSEKLTFFNFQGYTPEDKKRLYNYLLNNANIIPSLRLSQIDGEVAVTKGYQKNKLEIKQAANQKVRWTDEERQKIYNWILRAKVEIFKRGYLCFNDAYFLANAYILEVPKIKEILQTRFAYAFVDEAQDMEPHQYSLLEQLFYDEGQGNCVYQRIGDINQSIYSAGSDADTNWTVRPLTRRLIGSHRLTAINAGVVQKLAVCPIEVAGLNNSINGLIKPHIFIYTDANKQRVITEFGRLIKSLQEDGQLPAMPKHPFKAICWNTKPKLGNITLSDFHQQYSKEQQRPKINHNSLESYLVFSNGTPQSIGVIQKSILNGFLKVLRLEQKDAESVFTKTLLMKFLEETNSVFLNSFRLKLYIWCKYILQNNREQALAEIKASIPEFLGKFGKNQSASTTFINAALEVDMPAGDINSNIVNHDGIEIEVTTVHASKGQTHTATLYLESFYQGNYESERLSPYIKGAVPIPNMRVYLKQSMKMAYVGFSRATHLLCFAVHESRFNAHFADIDQQIWEVKRIAN